MLRNAHKLILRAQHGRLWNINTAFVCRVSCIEASQGIATACHTRAHQVLECQLDAWLQASRWQAFSDLSDAATASPGLQCDSIQSDHVGFVSIACYNCLLLIAMTHVISPSLAVRMQLLPPPSFGPVSVTLICACFQTPTHFHSRHVKCLHPLHLASEACAITRIMPYARQLIVEGCGVDRSKSALVKPLLVCSPAHRHSSHFKTCNTRFHLDLLNQVQILTELQIWLAYPIRVMT